MKAESVLVAAANKLAEDRTNLLFHEALDDCDVQPEVSKLLLQAVAMMDLATATLRLAAIKAGQG